ncbi:MAG: hypothetical protein ACXVB9_11465 [Bdellovibrionota bacterium]
MKSAPEQPSSSPTAEKTVAPEINEHDRAQVTTLENVLASHNDNDMRLDTELKVLDEGAKKLFQQKYEQISPEKRNQRGTVVFLLGRNLTHESDIAFMGKVLAEPPCRSMQNCASDPPHSGDVHGDNAVEASLAYPQLVALKSLERVLESGNSNPRFQQCMETVHKATQSPVAIVANLARVIEAKYSRH